jgi:hypothetical protein
MSSSPSDPVRWQCESAVRSWYEKVLRAAQCRVKLRAREPRIGLPARRHARPDSRRSNARPAAITSGDRRRPSCRLQLLGDVAGDAARRGRSAAEPTRPRPSVIRRTIREFAGCARPAPRRTNGGRPLVSLAQGSLPAPPLFAQHPDRGCGSCLGRRESKCHRYSCRTR